MILFQVLNLVDKSQNSSFWAKLKLPPSSWYHDTQQDDTKLNDTQHYVTQNNDTHQNYIKHYYTRSKITTIT